jgi:tetratricopeptide (TPR) repeat protein
MEYQEFIGAVARGELPVPEEVIVKIHERLLELAGNAAFGTGYPELELYIKHRLTDLKIGNKEMHDTWIGRGMPPSASTLERAIEGQKGNEAPKTPKYKTLDFLCFICWENETLWNLVNKYFDSNTGYTGDVRSKITIGNYARGPIRRHFGFDIFQKLRGLNQREDNGTSTKKEQKADAKVQDRKPQVEEAINLPATDEEASQSVPAEKQPEIANNNPDQMAEAGKTTFASQAPEQNSRKETEFQIHPNLQSRHQNAIYADLNDHSSLLNNLFKPFKRKKPAKLDIFAEILTPNIYPFSRVTYDREGKGYFNSVSCWIALRITNNSKEAVTIEDICYRDISTKEKSLSFLPTRKVAFSSKGVTVGDSVNFPIKIEANNSELLYLFIELSLTIRVQRHLYELYGAKIESNPAAKKAISIAKSNSDFQAFGEDNKSESNEFLAATYGFERGTTSILGSSIKLPTVDASGMRLSYSEVMGVLPNDFLYSLFKKLAGKDSKEYEKILNAPDIHQLSFTLYLIGCQKITHFNEISTYPFYFFTKTLESYKELNSKLSTPKDQALEEVKHLIKKRKFEDAKSKYFDVCETFTIRKDAFHHYTIATFERRLGNLEIALTHFRIANEFEPDNPDHVLAIGMCLMDLHKYENAIQVLEKLLLPDAYEAVEERKFQILELLAKCHYALQNYAKSNECYHTIIASAKSDVEQNKILIIELSFVLSQQLGNQHDYGGAISVLSEVEDLVVSTSGENSTHYVSYLNMMGVLHSGKNEFENVLIYFRRIESIFPKLPAVEIGLKAANKLNIANTLLRAENFAEAYPLIKGGIAFLETENSPSPKELGLLIEMHRAMARIFNNTEQFESAITYLERAIQLAKSDRSPENIKTDLHLFEKELDQVKENKKRYDDYHSKKSTN